MDCVTLFEEETVEGMQAEEEEPEAEVSGAPEWDEHVWTAPQNAISIVASMTDELCQIDPANADAYRANASAYTAQLTALDDSFRDVVDHAARKTVVFADRFPRALLRRRIRPELLRRFPPAARRIRSRPRRPSPR